MGSGDARAEPGRLRARRLRQSATGTDHPAAGILKNCPGRLGPIWSNSRTPAPLPEAKSFKINADLNGPPNASKHMWFSERRCFMQPDKLLQGSNIHGILSA